MTDERAHGDGVGSADDRRDQAETLRRVILLALEGAAEAYPQHADEVYVTCVDVDGQFVCVQVGVSNVTTYVTEIDSTDEALLATVEEA